MSTINVSIVDQNLTITNAPLIASGDINVDYVEFSFDGTWDGYGVVAVFYRDGEQQVYRSVVSPATNKALVPHEVLADEGRICFGVVGQKGNLTKTSVIGYYDIKRGAVTTGVDTQPPTPGIYEQMLEAVGDAKDAFDAALLEAEQLAGRVVICDCLAADLPSVVNTYGTLRRISLPEDMALADFDRVTVQLSNVGRNDLASGSTGQLVLLTNNDIQLGTITVPSTGGSAFIELAGLSGSPGNNIFRWSSVSNYGGATQEKKDTMASWGTEGVLANAERIDMLLTNDTYVRVIGYCNEVAGSTEGGGYVPPPTGIPASDLAPTVRAVLEKADAAKAFEVVDAVSASGSGSSRTVLLDCDFNDADDPAVLADLIIINLGDVLDGWAPDGTMLYEDRNDNGTPTFSSLPFISSGSAYFLTATMTVGTQSTSISVTKNAIASSSGGDAKPSGGWTTSDIADGAITEAKLGNGAVTSGKIGSGAVTSGKLGSKAVTTAKLDDKAVTKGKLDDSVQDSLDAADAALPASSYKPQTLGIGLALSDTQGGTVPKTASLGAYVLKANGLLAVRFTTPVEAGATLSITPDGGTTYTAAKPIYYKGSAITAGVLSYGDTALFVYDGTNFNLIGKWTNSGGGTATWADVLPPGGIPQTDLAKMTVTITAGSGTPVTYSSSKTFSEISTANTAGNLIVPVFKGFEGRCIDVGQNAATFEVIDATSPSAPVQYIFVISGTGCAGAASNWGGGSGPAVPTPTVADAGKILSIDSTGAYVLVSVTTWNPGGSY